MGYEFMVKCLFTAIGNLTFSLRFFMLQFELVCRTTGFRNRRFCAKFSATNRNRYWCYLFHFRETKWWKTGRFLCKSHFHSSLWRIELWIWNWDYFPSREHEFKTTSSEMSGNSQIYTRWNGFLDLGSSDNRFWKILPLLVLVQLFDFFKKIVLTSRISKVFEKETLKPLTSHTFSTQQLCSLEI